ncbi:MAG TPA: hypothetical protein VE011_10535 [Candidatus Dormibacteraeota bacterium]|nr:hypothetical protein [Candidatus Dormibacteraeota bacterium]
MAQIAFTPVLGPADLVSLVAAVRAAAGRAQVPTSVAGGLQLRTYTAGTGIDRVSLLAPDLAAVSASPPPFE